MSTVELRNKLKEKIDELNEDYLLEELLNIIALESNKADIVKIPEGHKRGLEISFKQMNEGKITSHNQVIKELRDGLGS